MKSSHAFTVMELLVIVGIIGILAALLMPALVSATEKSHRVMCMSSLKQIGLACAQYSPSYHDQLPCGANSVFGNMAIMSNYLGTPYILVCRSSNKTPLHNFSDPQASDAANVSFSYQVSLSNNSTASLIWQTNIDDVVVWDQGVLGNFSGPNGRVGLRWAPTSNHKGAGGNVLFDDGSVAWKARTPTNMPLGCQNP